MVVLYDPTKTSALQAEFQLPGLSTVVQNNVVLSNPHQRIAFHAVSLFDDAAVHNGDAPGRFRRPGDGLQDQAGALKAAVLGGPFGGGGDG